MKRILLPLIILCLNFHLNAQELWKPYYVYPRTDEQHQDLSEDWNLTYTKQPIQNLTELEDAEWIHVEIPTSTHWAFYQAGKLPHPYKNLNSKEYLWMEEKVWYYQKEFTVPAFEQEYAFLTFDGLDYYAKIWLNDSLLGHHEGMLGGPAIEVSNLLKKGELNQITVELKVANAHYETPHPQNPGEIIKPYEMMGYTGAEPFFTVGMWRGVRLDFVPETHLERPFLTTEWIKDKQAQVKLQFEVLHDDHSGNHQLHPWAGWEMEPAYQNYLKAEPAGPGYELQLIFRSKQTGNIAFNQEMPVEIYQGRNWIEHSVTIENPEIWWPNNLGDQPLYEVELVLQKDDQQIDQIDLDFGIRTIEFEPSAGPRKIEYWKDWQMVVNGKEIFVKGINWMPADVLLDLPREKYQWLIKMAKAAGIQIFRVWGVGLIETNDFYDLCNQYGIMVMQDFPNANSLTPEWPQEIWEAQVLWNVFRLRNQPSLVMYGGGNEFNPYAKGNAASTGILQRTLEDFDDSRMFLPSSPFGGAIHSYPDMDPSWYRKLYKWVPFILETGIHSICPPDGLRKVVDNDEFNDLGNLFSEDFKENHPDFTHHFVQFNVHMVPKMLSRGSHVLNIYENPTLEELATATQVGAGEFYQVLSEGMQSNFPFTTGLVPWTYKRPWPVVSAIHLVDGFGQPSAPYYFLKRTYDRIHVAWLPERLLWKPGEEIPFQSSIIIDPTVDVQEKYLLNLQVFNKEFKLLTSRKKEVQPVAGNVLDVELEPFTIPDDLKNQFFFVVVSLTDSGGEKVSESVYWPRTIKQMNDPEFYQNYTHNDDESQTWPILENGPWLMNQVQEYKSKLKTNLIGQSKTPEGYQKYLIEIENTGKYPLFMTTIDIVGSDNEFYASDNYFWLSAGEIKNIELIVNWHSEERGKIYISAWNSKVMEIQL